eukprot:CAMPEP_0170297322 /NCGR_PEP_ID=MMETSP0116_2-20130129/48821_1 /TAXON_ID=400756 /ORGANISM="Durinskia baltica, Strain CSIRO CS-38" /LENGTH=66 /DNA_ID=CAMNT_0010548945 /DNA_START=30 /DNA_END=227 /DNA_ORIENTATION=-
MRRRSDTAEFPVRLRHEPLADGCLGGAATSAPTPAKCLRVCARASCQGTQIALPRLSMQIVRPAMA